MELELISFKICPFVQRSVITLNYKEVPYRITYIDLGDPPAWFHEISPFGKVPLLKVDDREVLFESAVINEFVDEITPPLLQPTDPLKKALNRAWIEFGSECLMTQFQMLLAKDQEAFDGKREDLRGKLARIEELLGEGPYFNGPGLSLVDAAYAPLFMRLNLLKEKGIVDDAFYGPGSRQWSDVLLSLSAVKESVVEDFEELFFAHVKELGGFAARKLSG